MHRNLLPALLLDRRHCMRSRRTNMQSKGLFYSLEDCQIYFPQELCCKGDKARIQVGRNAQQSLACIVASLAICVRSKRTNPHSKRKLCSCAATLSERKPGRKFRSTEMHSNRLLASSLDRRHLSSPDTPIRARNDRSMAEMLAENTAHSNSVRKETGPETHFSRTAQQLPVCIIVRPVT